MQKTNPNKARIIPSRYKQAANDASSKSGTNSSSSFSKSGGSFEKPERKKTGFKTAAAASVPNLSQIDQSSQACKPKTKMGHKLNPKLHSTALHSTTFMEETRIGAEKFSMTVVTSPKRFHSSKLASLSELSDDISSLCSPDPNETVQKTAFCLSEEADKVPVEDEDSSRDFTTEEINAEYLKYLTWAYVDVASRTAFEKQVKEGKKQNLFLTQLIEEEQKKLGEEQLKLELLQQYHRLTQNYETLKEKLLKLNETVPTCSEALNNLTQHLEIQLNNIKLENIYEPADMTRHKDDFQDMLEENVRLLSEINEELAPQTRSLQARTDLVENLSQEIDDINHCLAQGEKAASLAIQEASLKLTVKMET